MNVLELFKPINFFVFDVDGVLTDGSLFLMPGGIMARRMNIKDGYALQLAIKKNYFIAAISGSDSPEVTNRLLKLGVQNVFMNVENKLECLKNLINKNGIEIDKVLFMGDDVPDMEVMQYAGLACCPADAVIDVKKISKYISPVKGGEGCARDVIEKVMKLQGSWAFDMNVKSQ
jgi:3-deoxy-D-manno-octulosonate 8-phosphate phosphatase (KDO 8-P phosphatase)